MDKIDIEAAARALKALADTPLPEPLPYSFMRLGMLRALGYRGDGKPGDVIDLEGWKVKILHDELPSE